MTATAMFQRHTFRVWLIALSKGVLPNTLWEATEREAALASLKVYQGLGLGIAGTHRTGKTTLAKELSASLGLPFLETSVKAIAEEYGFNVDSHSNFDERLDWQEYLLGKLGEKFAAQTGPFIADRTPLCMLAYTLADAPNGPITPEQDARLNKYIQDCLALCNDHFLLTVVVPTGIPYEAVAGAPAFNTAYQEKVAALSFAYSYRVASTTASIHRSFTELEKRKGIVTQLWNEELSLLKWGIEALPDC